jgi:hypothetical protein
MSCDVTAMPISHPSFFATHLMITAMHAICLASADITSSHFLMNPVMLVV